MIMLRPSEPIRPVPVYSTGYDISDDDSENIVIELGSFFRGSETGTIRFRNKPYLHRSQIFLAHAHALATGRGSDRRGIRTTWRDE